MRPLTTSQRRTGLIGFRSERLTVIDRGVIPKSPSSPNLPLNVVPPFCWCSLRRQCTWLRSSPACLIASIRLTVHAFRRANDRPRSPLAGTSALDALLIGLCAASSALAPTPWHTFAVMAVAGVLQRHGGRSARPALAHVAILYASVDAAVACGVGRLGASLRTARGGLRTIHWSAAGA